MGIQPSLFKFGKNINRLNRIYLKKAALASKDALIRSIRFISDDSLYRMHFIRKTSAAIYRQHVQSGFSSCIFCKQLAKSGTSHGFFCTLGTYTEHTCLLPEPFCSLFGAESHPSGTIPWIFKTPCSAFSRLYPQHYFRHFKSVSGSQTVSNYEILEGLFLGLVHGKRPCHICVSVNPAIYDMCRSLGAENETSPCYLAFRRLYESYRVTV